MLCDRTDRNDADSLNQTGTDKDEVTFRPIPEMPVSLSFDGVHYGFVQYSIMFLPVFFYSVNFLEFVFTANLPHQQFTHCGMVFMKSPVELSVSFLSCCR